MLNKNDHTTNVTNLNPIIFIKKKKKKEIRLQ